MKPNVSTPEPGLDAAFDHVFTYWPTLTRRGDSLAFPLSGRFVKPGGFFKWFFYWDSYFTLLGLVVQGKWQLAREIVEGFVTEIEAFGHVPNYNGPQSVCSSRSQSPFLTSAIREVYPSVNDLDWLDRAVSAAATEYRGYWLAEPHITEIGLSRYIDIEEDEGCATVPDTPHYRAIGESGWDNTPRLGDDASGFYWDYDIRSRERLRDTPRSLASFVPLWAGVADQDQASRVVDHLPAFEYDHGLVACEEGWSDETEHNYPTGWPYSHWYVCDGLRAYGFHEEASRTAMKWLRLMANEFTNSGVIRERHNVVDPEVPVPGRYPPQRGFGWTNGVFVALLVRTIFGIEPAKNGPGIEMHPRFPPEWTGKETQLYLPNYPWPEGVILKKIAT